VHFSRASEPWLYPVHLAELLNQGGVPQAGRPTATSSMCVISAHLCVGAHDLAAQLERRTATSNKAF
jgi:hypothetical protein